MSCSGPPGEPGPTGPPLEVAPINGKAAGFLREAVVVPPESDVESKVVALDVEGSDELERAKELVEKVAVEKRLWIAAWHAKLLDPSKAMIEELPVGVGCWAGSCALMIGERTIAKFVVRYREEKCDADVQMDMPRVDDESGLIGAEEKQTHTVLYEHNGGRVDWACEELNLEGSAPSVEVMKSSLVAKYGFRFNFVAA